MTTRSHENFHSPETLRWLLEGDVSVQYQTLRDLIGEERSEIQERIGAEGFGARFLDRRKPDGHWGNGFYNPKWACTHYTLLDLKNIGFSQEHSLIQESVKMVADTLKE